MREQVRGHEAAIRVSRDTDAFGICDAHFRSFVDGGLRRSDHLFDVGVVHLLDRSDNRHRSIVENRVAVQEKEEVRRACNCCEAFGGPRHLPCRIGIVVFERIRPHNRWQTLARLIARRQIQRKRKRYAIGTLIGHKLL